MLPPLTSRIQIFPGLDIVPESPQYHIFTKSCAGWIIVSKDGEKFRVRFSQVTHLDPETNEFFALVVFKRGDRGPWLRLVKEILPKYMLNGYEPEDIVFFQYEIPEALVPYQAYPIMSFMKEWMKIDVLDK